MKDTKKKALIAFEAEQLLMSEMNAIKGGLSEPCESCSRSCQSSCSGGNSGTTTTDEL